MSGFDKTTRREILGHLALLAFLFCSSTFAGEAPRIILGAKATPLEKYAAQELQRYLYLVSGTWLAIVSEGLEANSASFIIGQPHTNPLLKRLVAGGYLSVSPKYPGPQGYVLKTFQYSGNTVTVIGGSDESGVLYGVYGLLADYYEVGFFFSGDVLPAKTVPLKWAQVDEQKAPAMKIRGLLPWSNFPQSSASYSWADWKYLIDQMARLRLNFLQVHNYCGERGYNEMFANFTLDGFTARGGLATARTGHPWHGPGWQLTNYLFQAGDLFDDYDFGAECALHNETLSNQAIHRKGVSLFQKIISYAHSRGVKVGLGLDINLIPAGYQALADDPRVIAARVDQIAGDYPDLDYLICFQSEESDKHEAFQAKWLRIFTGFYQGMKARAPGTKLAVSGWGLEPKWVAQLPAEVICAPLAHYSSQFENGAIYGSREYWGCPWLERDQISSQYYYPYNMHLSDLIKAYRNRANNMTGLCALSWRLTDAIEPRISYLSEVPWDNVNHLSSAKVVYRRYAARCFGAAAADEIRDILNQNEPFASDFAECQGTPLFVPASGPGLMKSVFGSTENPEMTKCRKQLATVGKWLGRAASASQAARFERLHHRLAAVRDHLALNEQFDRYGWEDLPGAFPSWTSQFMTRVTDVSSLGNLVSLENRFIQLRYLPKENAFRARQPVRAPSAVVARGTKDGAVITWRNEEPGVAGFNLYRDGRRLNSMPLRSSARSYTDRVNGNCLYRVSAVNSRGRESPRSVLSACPAGTADHRPPQIVLLSPPTSMNQGQNLDLKARLIDDRTYDSLAAFLVYRGLGTTGWKKISMTRRTKGIFAIRVPSREIPSSGLAYHIEASDGDNTSRFPPSAPDVPLSVIVCESAHTSSPGVPGNPIASAQGLTWTPAVGEAFWYCIYRGETADFKPGPANFLTYVSRETTSFKDSAEDFDGQPLHGIRYYRISAQDKAGNESTPTESLPVLYGK